MTDPNKKIDPDQEDWGVEEYDYPYADDPYDSDTGELRGFVKVDLS